jgi:hypothetical protein
MVVRTSLRSEQMSVDIASQRRLTVLFACTLRSIRVVRVVKYLPRPTPIMERFEHNKNTKRKKKTP